MSNKYTITDTILNPVSTKHDVASKRNLYKHTKSEPQLAKDFNFLQLEDEFNPNYSMPNNSTVNNQPCIPKTTSQVDINQTVNNFRDISKNIFDSSYKLEIKNIIIVAKDKEMELLTPVVLNVIKTILNIDNSLKLFINENFQQIDIANPNLIKEQIKGFKDDSISYWNENFIKSNKQFFDLVITLGGDGCVLYVSKLFQDYVPPIMPIAVNVKGFLITFEYKNFKNDIKRILNDEVNIVFRIRLACKIFRHNNNTKDAIFEKEVHVLNEVSVYRGLGLCPAEVELYINGHLLSTVKGDGIIVATPTGSTAYSLSAGGPLLHPKIHAISVTPICPHTLSIRPLVVSDTCTVKLRPARDFKKTVWASFDGKHNFKFSENDYISISSSPYVFPVIETSKNEYIENISRRFGWNKRVTQKAFDKRKK